MPPAPAGGSVGMGPNGGWATNSGTRTAIESKNSRIPGAARAGKSNHGLQGSHSRRSVDHRNVEAHTSRARQGVEDPARVIPPWQRDSGLPPKPPTSTHQTWAAVHSSRAGRDNAIHQGRYVGRPDGNLDSYVPNYLGGFDSRHREGEGPISNSSSDRDWDWRNIRHDGPRQINRRDHPRENNNSSRRRSRSPDFREGLYTSNRPPYRR